MPALFILDVATDPAAGRVTLHLHEEGGRALEEHVVTLAAHRPALWEGLFDTRRHVRRMASVEAPEAQLAALGRFLGAEVLGAGIARRLAEGEDQRTVLVLLPDPSGDDLAAAFARVPWERARAPGDEKSLLDRNVVVRAAPASAKPGRERAIEVEPGKPVRVLLVFAEAPGSRPLAMRLERERLRDLFFEEVLPTRNVEVDVLCHGVTRRRLREQVRARGGYHVVHWSGHGHVNALEIALEEGEEAEGWITGRDLVGLFSGECGLIPRVVFLSACHSGSLLKVKDWASFRAALGEPEGDTRQRSPALDEMLKKKAGFTGAALDLIEAGVKQVVAMRYEVGDAYARDLAHTFYRRLLADPAHHAVDAALASAKRELARDEKRAKDYQAIDHATAVVFGSDAVRIEPAARPSVQMMRKESRPQPLLPSGSRELDPHENFVGRGRELTALMQQWLPRAGTPIALIQGMAGLGKTALAAEVIHLSFEQFAYVFCFQAKGGAPLSIETFYQRLDHLLTLKSPAYLQRCQDNPMDRVYLEAGSMKGAEREEAMRNNLLDALGYERMLVVLDNFETNLLTTAGPQGYATQDPAWDRLLETLGDRLSKTGSRVVVTSRHRLAALTDVQRVLSMHLGPLSIAEARLFYEGNRPLRDLLQGDEAAQRLAHRVLDVSRGHPLILQRLGDLVRAYHLDRGGLTPEGRKVLEEALDKIQGEGFQALPDVFRGTRTETEREQERTYLEDVAGGAVDLLVERLSADARRLLWVVTRVEELTTAAMIADVWGTPPTVLLTELCDAGLLVRDGNAYGFHQLVTEHATAWMEKYPSERGGRTESDIWTAYGSRYGVLFEALRAAAMRELASEVGRRGIRYLVRARAFESLGAFASGVVTGTRDPMLLGQVIADLQTAADTAPAGRERWRLRTYLADALLGAGRADQALSLYAQAAEEARSAEHWLDLGWIDGNRAVAFRNVSQLDRALQMHMSSADAKRRAGRPRIEILGSEIEALRVAVMQGRAEEALPVIEAILGEMRAWWALRQEGKPVAEAPEDESLARALAGGLNTANYANLMLERWQCCLDLLDEAERVKKARGYSEHEVARTRINRCTPLIRLDKLAEAKAVIQDCLDVFHRVQDVTSEATALAMLADVWDALGDTAQAMALGRHALTVRERLPNPEERAISHNNLASSLYVACLTEGAKAHQLAALVYILVTDIHHPEVFRHLAARIAHSADCGETFTFPRVVDLLADSAFAPLQGFLDDNEVALDELQASIDAIVERVRADISVSSASGNSAPT